MDKIEELEKEINDVEETLNNLKTKVEELKKNKNDFEPTPKGWMPKFDERYWYANECLDQKCYINRNDTTDKKCRKYNRIFKTKEECDLYCDIQKAFRNASKEFGYKEFNYFLWYNYDDDNIAINFSTICKNAMLYFDSEETIQKLIDKFGEENVKRYYFGVY